MTFQTAGRKPAEHELSISRLIDAPRYIRLHERDNVVIVVNDQGVPAGTEFPDGLVTVEFVPQSHKVAELCPNRFEPSASIPVRKIPRPGPANTSARPWKVFFLITIPMIAPSLAAGGMMSFALSLDDLVLASFVSGPGSPATRPMASSS